MSGIQNKNLIFYSTFPNDRLSVLCLGALDTTPALNKQFIRICIHDPRDITKPPSYNLPVKVQQCMQHGLMPILAIAGFKDPVFADSALNWLKNNALNQSPDVMPSNIHGGGTADNCCTIEQAGQSGNALFDTDYNIGFATGQGEFNKKYASIDEAASDKIPTYDEYNDKKDAAMDINKRLDKLKTDRNDLLKTQGPGGGSRPLAPPPPPPGPQYGRSGMPQYSAPPSAPPSRGMMPQYPSMPQYQPPPPGNRYY